MSRRLLGSEWLGLDVVTGVPDLTADHHGGRAGAARMRCSGWGLIQRFFQAPVPFLRAHLMSPVVERTWLHPHFRHDLPIVIVGPVALVQQEGRDVHALLPLHNAHGTGKRGWVAFQG